MSLAAEAAAPAPADAALTVEGLGVDFGAGPAAAGVGFALGRGEILGIVGESGSGKSVTCRALLGLLPRTARVTGRMTFGGAAHDLARPSALAALRGAGLSMIFQDPMSALDPLMSVRRHLAIRGVAAPEPLLRQAGLAEPAPLLDAFPHQLSGGQCQRVAIACALARDPAVLIADEPTTALDVTVQAGILEELRRLAAARGMAVLLITHDLAVVHALCRRVLVMHRGRVVEAGPVADVLARPREPYTQGLLRAIPRPARRGLRLASDAAPAARPAIGAPVLTFDGVTVRYPRVTAVDGVSLTVRAGEIVGLVGESGSGKSTLAKTAVGLATPEAGQVRLGETALDWRRPEPAWRRRIQYIFQDPRGALDPSARILAQVRLPLEVHRAPGDRTRAAEASMAETGLAPELYRRKPGALSGGQRQRATIARALTLRPELLICDESVSALDVSVQARVLDLLADLRARFGLAILFISHDLGVIQHLCDRVAVMRAGRLVEEGPVDSVFARPAHAYTQALLAAVPRLPEAV